MNGGCNLVEGKWGVVGLQGGDSVYFYGEKSEVKCSCKEMCCGFLNVEEEGGVKKWREEGENFCCVEENGVWYVDFFFCIFLAFLLHVFLLKISKWMPHSIPTVWIFWNGGREISFLFNFQQQTIIQIYIFWLVI